MNEEWVIVLTGEPTLRTPDGEHVLKEGDVVCFPRGKDGCASDHQPNRLADSRTHALVDDPRGDHRVLDTGKVLAKDVEDEDVMFARPGPPAEYWEGEE